MSRGPGGYASLSISRQSDTRTVAVIGVLRNLNHDEWKKEQKSYSVLSIACGRPMSSILRPTLSPTAPRFVQTWRPDSCNGKTTVNSHTEWYECAFLSDCIQLSLSMGADLVYNGLSNILAIKICWHIHYMVTPYRLYNPPTDNSRNCAKLPVS